MGLCANYKMNLQLAALFCWLTATSAAYAQAAHIVDVRVPGFGVPLTVLAMAAAGSLVGFAYTPPLDTRRKLYTLALANTLISAWMVVLIPEWRGWNVTPAALPPLAGVMAAVNCVIVPALFKRLPSIVNIFINRIFQSNTEGKP